MSTACRYALFPYIKCWRVFGYKKSCRSVRVPARKRHLCLVARYFPSSSLHVPFFSTFRGPLPSSPVAFLAQTAFCTHMNCFLTNRESREPDSGDRKGRLAFVRAPGQAKPKNETEATCRRLGLE